MTTFRVVAFNDTQHWNLPSEFAGKVRIYSRYMYNPNEATYCCELTPSRFLCFLGSEWLPVDDLAEEFTDEQKEELYDFLLENDSREDQDTYMWTSNVDKRSHYEIEVEDEDPKDAFERAFEYARGNVQMPKDLQ